MGVFRYLIFFFVVLVHSQNNSKYSNEFMNIGVDAASISMSGAVTSSTNNVNSGYWNPAGLVEIEESEISLMHSNYFANVANYNYLAYASPIDDRSSIGFSMIRFGVDDILDTTQLIDNQGNINYDRINLFSAVDYGFIISYARKMLTKDISYGINAKIIRRVIGDFATSWGFGFDVGLQLKTNNNWKFGIMARDITTTYNSWSINESGLSDIQTAIDGQNQEIPNSSEITIPKIQFGVSKYHTFNYDYTLLTAFDLIMKFEQNNNLLSTEFVSINPALGLELGYIDTVFLRLGLGNFQNEIEYDNSNNMTFQPNFGVGFKYKDIEIDYAFTDIGDQSVALYSNIFSLKVDFNIFR
jgi:hypothetical protein